jgi:uncharacterized alpha-E superfamily protein
VIARVADHCFWLGRYVERTESTAKNLAVTTTIALDAELAPRRSWHPVVIVSGQEEDFLARFGKEALADAEVVQNYMARDMDNPVSIVRSAAAARENARSIREVISLEVWQIMNELKVFLGSDEADHMYATDRHAFYARVQRATQLVLGLLRSTMLHDDPLDFIWLGVLLERAGQTARLLDVQHHALVAEGAPHVVLETALWLSLLRACSGFEPFMKTNRGKVNGPPVAAFLILEPRFPRSVIYAVRASRERLAKLLGDGAAPGRGALERLRALEAYLGKVAPEELAGTRVHEILTHVVDEVHAVCSAIRAELLGQANGKPLVQAQTQ